MKKIKNGILIMIISLFALSCSSGDSGLNLVKAAERQKVIDSMDAPGALNYWHYEVPGMEDVLVGEERYMEDLYFDIYYPPGFDFRKSLPVLISAESRTNEGRINAEEKSIRFDRSSFSLGQIMAASGVAVLIYETNDPNEDVDVLLKHLEENQKRLKIDVDRTAVWARSRHAVSALRTVSKEEYREYITPLALILSCPNFLGPYDIPQDVPILLTTSYDVGKLAVGTTVFLDKAAKEDKEVELIEYEDGMPDFENKIDSTETRRIIGVYIDFLKTKLEI